MANKSIPLLEFGIGIFNKYRSQVAKNENITYEDAQKKLTRNMILAHQEFNPYAEDGDESDQGTLYKYGHLWFIVRNNRVKWLRTNCHHVWGWEKDMKKYNELNQILGIAE
jgi:hypothetical protein